MSGSQLPVRGLLRIFGFRAAVGGALLILIAFPQNVYGYTDPGSGALLLQIVSAAFLGIVFYLHRLRSWFKRKR